MLFTSRLRLLAPCVGCLLLLVAGSGCNTMSTVPRANVLNALRQAKDQPPAEQRLVLKTKDGANVRVDPRSKLRFELKDGSVTEWIRASALRTSELGLHVGKETVAAWDEVAHAEVENLSGPKVLAGTVLVVGVAAIVATVAILSATSKGGKSKSKARSRGGSGGSWSIFGSSKSRDRRRVRRRYRPRRRYRRRTRFSLRPAVHIAVAGSVSSAPPSPPPGTPMAMRRPQGAAPAQGAAPVDIERPAPAALPLSATKPLFSASAQRRSSFRFFGAASLGTDFRETNGLSDSLTLGIRFAELFELGGGFRHMLVDHTPQGASRSQKDSSYLGFIRAGLHIDLDAGRYVAVPMSMDIGFGDPVRVQWRFNWGLRVRPADWLWIGIYPFSPTYTSYKDKSRLAAADKWSFPTSVELGFSF